MRTAGKRKITYGHVIQTFDDEGKVVDAEFVVGDLVEWEEDDLRTIRDVDAPDYEAPIHIVQATNMAVVICGNLSEGFGAVGPFPTLEDALLWSEGVESWCMTMQNPHEEFDNAKIETPIAKYIRTDGVRCPHCNSDDLSCGEVRTGDVTMYRGVVCGSCKKEWTDEYTLTGVTDE